MSLYIGEDIIGKVVVGTSGGTVINNQNKTVTPTESQQTVTADAGYTGLGTVTVNAISRTYVGSSVPRRSSTDLTLSGAAVTAPSGYYGEQATLNLTAKGAATYNTSTTDQTISSGQYLTGVQTIKAVTVSGLSANSILSGVTVKVGDANDDDRIASVTGTVSFQTYYTGSSAPSSSLGVDGDIYLQTS